MIRYVVSFADDLTPSTLYHIRQEIRAAADAREFRDVVLANGGTITDMRRPSRVPALVRRAKALAR